MERVNVPEKRGRKPFILNFKMVKANAVPLTHPWDLLQSFHFLLVFHASFKLHLIIFSENTTYLMEPKEQKMQHN